MKGQSELELARAYIKDQQYTKRFSPLEGLQKGTIFPELYMPYEKKKSKEPLKHEPQRERSLIVSVYVIVLVRRPPGGLWEGWEEWIRQKDHVVNIMAEEFTAVEFNLYLTPIRTTRRL